MQNTAAQNSTNRDTSARNTVHRNRNNHPESFSKCDLLLSSLPRPIETCPLSDIAKNNNKIHRNMRQTKIGSRNKEFNDSTKVSKKLQQYEVNIQAIDSKIRQNNINARKRCAAKREMKKTLNVDEAPSMGPAKHSSLEPNDK